MGSRCAGADPDISVGGHEAPKAPRSSAAGVRFEAPKAPRVMGLGEWDTRGGVPLPNGSGVWGGGCAPSTEFFFTFWLEMVHFGIYSDTYDYPCSSQGLYSKLKREKSTIK